MAQGPWAGGHGPLIGGGSRPVVLVVVAVVVDAVSVRRLRPRLLHSQGSRRSSAPDPRVRAPTPSVGVGRGFRDARTLIQVRAVTGTLAPNLRPTLCLLNLRGQKLLT